LHGGTQEGYRRAGTENVPAIIGMAVALVECCGNGFFSSYIKSISDFIWDELRYKVGGVYLNGNRVQSVPHILNFIVEGVPSDVLISMLSNVYGVYCSTGSACCSGESEPSHVLKAMGISDEHALSSVRLSLSRYSTEQEMVFAVNAIRECVLRLRGWVNAM
jgi:cysteine desulfurase